jgi:hypothetical protein
MLLITRIPPQEVESQFQFARRGNNPALRAAMEVHEMAFRAARTVVALEAEEVMRLQQVLMDEDAGDALTFLRDVVAEKVNCAQDDTHRPEFEGGIRPEGAHHPPASESHDDSGESG